MTYDIEFTSEIYNGMVLFIKLISSLNTTEYCDDWFKSFFFFTEYLQSANTLHNKTIL